MWWGRRRGGGTAGWQKGEAAEATGDGRVGQVDVREVAGMCDGRESRGGEGFEGRRERGMEGRRAAATSPNLNPRP